MGATGGHIFHWGADPLAPRRTAPDYFLLILKIVINIDNSALVHLLELG